eukprot:6209950-Pleurochrysis_carterae.AAC.1
MYIRRPASKKGVGIKKFTTASPDPRQIENTGLGERVQKSHTAQSTHSHEEMAAETAERAPRNTEEKARLRYFFEKRRKGLLNHTPPRSVPASPSLPWRKPLPSRPPRPLAPTPPAVTAAPASASCAAARRAPARAKQAPHDAQGEGLQSMMPPQRGLP